MLQKKMNPELRVNAMAIPEGDPKVVVLPHLFLIHHDLRRWFPGLSIERQIVEGKGG